MLELRSQALGKPEELRDTTDTPQFPSQAIPNNGMISPVWHGYLLRIYFDSIHRIYPILNSSAPWLSPGVLMGLEAHPTQAFILQMVYAVACHCDTERSSSLLSLASATHGRALKRIDKATAEQSASTLQGAILLVLYALFDPTSGNVSQQLGFAIRLAIDLAASEGDEEPLMLSTLHKIIYCLEQDVCGVLVRPTSLPEPASPLTFATEQPLDLLCTLYRIQSRIRRKTADSTLQESLLRLADHALDELHPNILSTVWETRLFLDPSASVAMPLIAAYSKDGYIPTFLTAHRVHRAVNIIIDAVSSTEGSLKYDLLLAYGNATALLGRWSAMWEAPRILLRDIQSRMGFEAASRQSQAGRQGPSTVSKD